MGRFNPAQVIFAPTARCNLACGHCRVDRARGQRTGENELDAEDALRFLTECAEHGIDRVGFSGGEPFLKPDFLVTVIRAACENGQLFDRLMTNGDWWDTEATLHQTLRHLADAGFDGTIGLSVDSWHAQEPERLALFIRAVHSAFGRGDCCEIVSVLNDQQMTDIPRLSAIADLLNAELVLEDGIVLRIEDTRWKENRRRGIDDGSGILIPVLTLPRSRDPAEPGAWDAARWFTDDWCEGPGQIWFVHPDGQVAVCCGFANERPELIAGSIKDGYDTILKNTQENPYIRTCYEKGLGTLRCEMEKAGMQFPGKTDDICFFCDWLCQNTVTGDILK